MTTPRTIDSYGGKFLDTFPVEDPTIEQSADYVNRVDEDLAQITRTGTKIIVRFPTTLTAGPVAVTPSSGASHMGLGMAELPTIAKSATGLYDITYPTTWTDGLSLPENIAFRFSHGTTVSLSAFGKVQTTEAGNVIHVAIFDAAAALTDLGGGVTIQVEAR